jgi:uncharacterized membrane protein
MVSLIYVISYYTTCTTQELWLIRVLHLYPCLLHYVIGLMVACLFFEMFWLWRTLNQVEHFDVLVSPFTPIVTTLRRDQ